VTVEPTELYDKYGNPLNPEILKREDCLACQEEIPFKWSEQQKKFVHLDLFATAEYGTTYDCPVQRERE